MKIVKCDIGKDLASDIVLFLYYILYCGGKSKTRIPQNSDQRRIKKNRFLDNMLLNN